MLSPEQITAIAYHALEDKKAKDVKILKTAEHTILADLQRQFVHAYQSAGG